VRHGGRFTRIRRTEGKKKWGRKPVSHGFSAGTIAHVSEGKKVWAGGISKCEEVWDRESRENIASWTGREDNYAGVKGGQLSYVNNKQLEKGVFLGSHSTVALGEKENQSPRLTFVVRSRSGHKGSFEEVTQNRSEKRPRKEWGTDSESRF